MSHWTEVKTQIKDVNALVAAAQEMGYAVQFNAPCRGYVYGPGGPEGYVPNPVCDVVVKLKGAFDLGLNKQPDGTYAIKADLWKGTGGHERYTERGTVEEELGKGYQRLLQNYAFHAVAIAARRKGLSVVKSVNTDGTYRVVLTGRSL